ncbi:hypothetical protein NX778_17375 [Massilia terrae]|uniref:Uncharacterized protein n=1 Tax=Massilia terrae TaxID=1811224 RepID=A0ABT2D0T0_9BURK|nr:hypothetical protein [Massilia terrae]MCS0659846.1 hypothetical protein [Massilia terrae]
MRAVDLGFPAERDDHGERGRYRRRAGTADQQARGLVHAGVQREHEQVLGDREREVVDAGELEGERLQPGVQGRLVFVAGPEMLGVEDLLGLIHLGGAALPDADQDLEEEVDAERGQEGRAGALLVAGDGFGDRGHGRLSV